MLLVHPTPTYTDVGLDLQLALVVFFFHQLTQMLHLYSCNLYCVVMVVCGGIQYRIHIFK